MLFGRLTGVGPTNHVLDGVEITHGKWQFLGWPDRWKRLGVFAGVYAAKGTIPSSI